MRKDTSGPAFPTKRRIQRAGYLTDEYEPCGGMTLRDYFAAKAAAGICASKDEAGVLVQHGYDWIATEAYNIADAMLKARAA